MGLHPADPTTDDPSGGDDGTATGRGRRPTATEPGKSLTPRPGGVRADERRADEERTLEGAEAEAAVADAARRTTSRQALGRHPGFEEVSPEVGQLDEAAFDDALEADPDEALALLADLTGATDHHLRDLARRLAGRVVVDVVRTGAPRGVASAGSATHPPTGRPASSTSTAGLEALATARAHGVAPALDELHAREWSRPDLALCLLVDRSGSMGGGPAGHRRGGGRRLPVAGAARHQRGGLR